ncbi:hypothetical protein HQ533_05135 [Candidatus Woesearchaeota archaeon]|nr:hypothetical protein [Candidatus Woesearchaeota archaeon]
MRITNCIFCRQQAIAKNEQGFATCNMHKKEVLPEMNCACKEILSIKNGKYGAFFICANCGPISLKKALSINPLVETEKKAVPKEITIRSDEIDFL